MTEHCLALVTVGTREEGRRIADALVQEHLAACVNVIGPIESIYRWQGAVQRDDELLLLIKTRAALFARLAARVGALHSYENPEVVALPIVAGADAYLRWLQAMTEPPGA